MPKLRCRLLFLSVFSSLYVVGPAACWAAEPFMDAFPREMMEDVMAKMGGSSMLIMADKYGVNRIKGKKILDTGERESQSPNDKKTLEALTAEADGADQPVGTDPFLEENEPSINVSPTDSTKVVALTHHINAPPTGNTIGSYWSNDSGATWDGPSFVPFVIDGDFHSDPVIRYSPTGKVVYACYMSIRGATADIAVSRSFDNGKTWQPPVIAIKGKDYDNDGFLDFPDKPWCDVHTFAETDAQKKKLYLTTTLFHSNGDISILFARSVDEGESFGSPEVLDTVTLDSGVVLQGSRPIGGKGGDVLACWYDSERDGWLNGVFDIRCRTSIDFGKTWGSQFAAVDDVSHELPFWLGPFASFHRWWGGMFPSMIITKNGLAHITVAADPVQGSSNAEDGDIYYVRSPRPYGSWSRPSRLNDGDDRHAQGYVTITAKEVTGANIVSACWEDHQQSSNKDNELYDTYCDLTLPAWGEDMRLSDVSSYSDFLFIGDYIDSSTSKDELDRTTHVIWTDRSDKDTEFDLEDDVWADKLEY